jgi:tryptophan synthase alpha chain
MTPAARLREAILHPKTPGRPAVMPYLVSGWPDRAAWAETLLAVSEVADAIEVGVPFSDPMADGPVIQKASREALQSGVTLRWILDTLAALPRAPGCPLVLMSYYNPLRALGDAEVVRRAAAAHVAGFIVPDLPWEEGAALRGLLTDAGLAAVQLVTPVTPPDRLGALTAARDGFVYAVTITGITGGALDPATVRDYLDRVRTTSAAPVCAGFGIRTPADVASLTGHADGAIVGTAMIELQRAGGDPVAFVRRLRGE